MKIHLRPLSLVTSAVMFVLFAASGFAQGYGTIIGTVSDSTGEVVSGAKVTVTDAGTQLQRTVQTNDQGYYVIPALHPSTYDLVAAAPGFAAYSQKSVTLLADQSLTVDVHLSIGQVTQTVSVESNSLQVDTATSTLSQVVEERRIVDLPLNGRNAVSLALLVRAAEFGDSVEIAV